MNKKELLSCISKQLCIQAYSIVPGPGGAGAASVHYKRWNDLILLLGLEFSRHYSERFTASYYLSRSFHWGYMVRNFPSEAYRRIGDFLTPTERLRLLDKEFQALGVVDAWWIGFSATSCVSFIEAHGLTVERFLAQPNLAENVRSCKELQDYVNMANQTIGIATSLTQQPSISIHLPAKPKMNIGLEWYRSAERVLLEHKPKDVSTKYVELLAIDSWRLHSL